MQRRKFLKDSLLGAAALGVAGCAAAEPASRTGAAAGTRAPAGEVVDVNVNLSRWPFRRVRGDEPAELVAMLRAQGVVQAWASSYDGLLHKDLDGVNARLAEDCRRHGAGMLLPFGVVNPVLPDWEEDVRRAAEAYGMPGFRLYPGYHGYDLAAPALVRLLELAAARGLIVQLPVVMEDARMQHPFFRVPPVDLRPLRALVERMPALQVVVLNNRAEASWAAVGELVRAGRVYVDIARLEGTGGIEELLEHLPVERILFGSHAPYFYHEAAGLKLQESELTQAQASAIRSGNARAMLRRA